MRMKRIEMVVRADMVGAIIDLVRDYTSELTIKDSVAEKVPGHTRTKGPRGGSRPAMERNIISPDEARARVASSIVAQAILRKKGEWPLTKEFGNDTAADWLEEAHLNRNSVSPALSMLTRAGYLIRVHPGIYRFAP
jgi:hypothetical protein